MICVDFFPMMMLIEQMALKRRAMIEHLELIFHL